MRTRAIGAVAGLLGVFLLVPAQARDEPGQQRSEELYERVDEARARVELPVRGPAEPEPSDAEKKRLDEFVERTRVRVKENQDKYIETSKELGRAKRRLAELEGRVGRAESAKAPTTERRIRAIERIISEILREVED